MDVNNNNTTTTTSSTSTILTTATTTTTSSKPSPSALLYSYYYRSLSVAKRKEYDYHHQLPGEPSYESIVSILVLAIMVLVSSSLVLLATRYTSGGQSGTLVFLRSLLLSDILMALYGLIKMVFLLFLRQLRVNFFLPDSLFFTASLASSSSLLSLNLDCFLKLAKPFQYAQVEKHTVISFMMLIWNVAFIVGFLPLVGWHDERYTFRFFSFYPWHFLLFNGFIIFICVIICIACMISLKKFYTLPETDPSCFSSHSLEIRKYRHLHRTILIESAMWLASYLPFFIYISLTCRQCCLGDYVNKDSTVIYFLPVFLGKSLISAALQAFRTFHVHTVMNKIITDLSHHHHHHHHNHQEDSNRNNNHHNHQALSTISYTNPLCEQNENFQTPVGDVVDHRNNHNHHHHHHHQHHHQHPHLHHRHNNYQQHNHHDDRYPFHGGRYVSNQDIDSLHQEITPTNFLLDAENWTLHHSNALINDDVLIDDNGDDDDHAGVVMSSASLQLHDTDIVGITNLAFEASFNLDTEQQSTKL